MRTADLRLWCVDFLILTIHKRSGHQPPALRKIAKQLRFEAGS